MLRLKSSWLIAFWALLGTLCYPAADPEEDLRSLVVLSFLRYSTWPDPPVSNGPFTVGIVGRTSQAESLRRTFRDKTINGRAVRVLEMKTITDPRCCQVVYLATDKNLEIRQVLAAVQSAHMLTIGEADRFLESGGIVNLVELDGHMSFEVNLEALERSKVDISSKLLRLGQIKGRRPA